MPRAVRFFLALLTLAFNFGCGSAPSANLTSSNNVNAAANSTPANLPSGMSPSPVPPSTNTTPSANQVANTSNGAPAVPKVRTIKPGEKIPGIPDAATIKKQMSTPVDPSKLPPEFRRALNANTNSNANSPSMMMKKKPQ